MMLRRSLQKNYERITATPTHQARYENFASYCQNVRKFGSIMGIRKWLESTPDDSIYPEHIDVLIAMQPTIIGLYYIKHYECMRPYIQLLRDDKYHYAVVKRFSTNSPPPDYGYYQEYDITEEDFELNDRIRYYLLQQSDDGLTSRVYRGNDEDLTQTNLSY